MISVNNLLLALTEDSFQPAVHLALTEGSFQPAEHLALTEDSF
jgi:hypothetical protein